MLKQATADHPVLKVDDIELHGSVPSYSINTVHSFRRQIGTKEPLFLCMGLDVLCKLDQWYQWQELLSDCHIVVASRPGTSMLMSDSLSNWVNSHHCEDLKILQRQPGGKLHFCRLTMLDISSTAVRAEIKQGGSIDHMVPKQVVKYIKQHNLYN
jgi:nicotinate-nucleotide adenylyltransferase